MAGVVRVGISGWRYPPWRGVFYPKGLPQRAELSFAAERLSSIEINGTFYALQHPDSFRSWYAQTPDDFVFAVKGGRFITHLKKLRDVATPLANFFASGVLGLREKLGPLLWQLPPSLGYDPQRLTQFLHQLPRSTGEAAWLARRHDDRVDGRALTVIDADRPLRHAVEVRHASFAVAAFTQLLREHAVAVVVADTAGKWPLIRELTTDFAYVRLHGAEELYTSGYSPESLAEWATLLRAWTSAAQTGTGTGTGTETGTGAVAGADDGAAPDAFVYFDNDVKVHAPFDAMALARLLRAQPADPLR